MNRLLLWPLRWPKCALGLLLLLSGFFIAGLPRLRRDIRHERGFPDDDPRIEDYRLLKELFGADDETAFCVVEIPGDVLATEALDRFRALHDFLYLSPMVDSRRLVSLPGATFVRTIGENGLELAPLYDSPRRAGWRPELIAPLVARNPAFRDRLLSGDRHIAGFLIPVHPSLKSESDRRRFARFVKEELRRRLQPGERAWFEGFVLTKFDVLALLASDGRRFFPLTLLGLLVSLALIFGRVVPLSLAVADVVLSALWTLGMMAWGGFALSYISTGIPAMILVVCVGDSVYLLSRLDQLVSAGRAPREALEEAVQSVGSACFFTSLTTSAGFLSLGLSNIEIVRELGIPVALGVMASYFVTFALIPPVLLWFPARPGTTRSVTWFRRPLRAIASLVRRRPWSVVLAFLALMAGAGALLPGLRIESRLLEDLEEDEPLMLTRSFFEERMGGAAPLEVLIVTEEPDGVLAPELLIGLQHLCEELRSERFRGLGLLSALGLSDFLLDAQDTLDGRPAARGGNVELPKSKNGLAQLLFLFEMAKPDPTHDVVDFDRRVLRLQLRIKNHETTKFFRLVAAVREAGGRHLPPGSSLRVTGFTFMTQAAHQSLVRGLMSSFGVALCGVFGLILVFFRSLRLALLSLLPNLFPLVMVLALMVLTGVPLKLSTSLIFSIVFGIAVDDTLHFVAALHHRGGPSPAAIAATLEETGAAMILTSAVLVIGYSVLGVSHFKANQHFGVLISATMFFALLGDLLLLPALLQLGTQDSRETKA